MTFARRDYFEGALGYAGDIAVGAVSCSNDHEVLTDHDPDMIARAGLAYFSVQDARTSGAAQRVIRILEGSSDGMKALNGSFGNNAVGQGLSLQAERSQARIKPEPSPSNFHQLCVEIAGRMEDRVKPLHGPDYYNIPCRLRQCES